MDDAREGGVKYAKTIWLPGLVKPVFLGKYTEIRFLKLVWKKSKEVVIVGRAVWTA